MFANVIVGVDGSPAGRDAIQFGLALAQTGGRVTLAHVYGSVPTPGRTAFGPPQVSTSLRSSA